MSARRDKSKSRLSGKNNEEVDDTAPWEETTYVSDDEIYGYLNNKMRGGGNGGKGRNQRYNNQRGGNRDDRNPRELGRIQLDEYIVELDNNLVPISQSVISGEDIIKHDVNPQFAQSVEYSQFANGFHHWIHATKNKTEKFNQFQGKKRVYQVANGYERYIDEYEESIGNVSKDYFAVGKSKNNKNNTPDILSRAFYKLWEIIHYYNLIDNSKSFESAHLAEGPGSFIQTTMFYRDMHAGKDAKNDKYYAITIHSEEEDDTVPELEKDFITFYGKEKPQRFKMHKTYSKQVAGGSKTKDNGDLTDTKTIRLFKKDIGGKVDLVTGDGGFEWTNENIQEQESSKLVFAQILTALQIQKKGGSFVLKVFETFTRVSSKLLSMLGYFYEKVDIVKPLTSRSSNSEKYIVCRNFKYDEKSISKVLDSLMDSLDTMNATDKYLVDIFPSYEIPADFRVNIITINTAIANEQFRVINKMIEFIDGSNYHGEEYQNFRNRQIELTKFWIETFFYDKKDFASQSKKINKMIQDSNGDTQKDENRLNKNMDTTSMPQGKATKKTQARSKSTKVDTKELSRSKGKKTKVTKKIAKKQTKTKTPKKKATKKVVKKQTKTKTPKKKVAKKVVKKNTKKSATTDAK